MSIDSHVAQLLDSARKSLDEAQRLLGAEDWYSKRDPYVAHRYAETRTFIIAAREATSHAWVSEVAGPMREQA